MPSLTPPRSPEPTPSLIVALRLATAPIHEAVERLPGMVRLTGPDVTLADYRRYLSTMAQVYGTLEPPLYAALGALCGGPASTRPVTLGLRPKYPVLCADLAAHSLAPPRLARDEQAPPDLNTAVGGLYVLEGSTIGGRVVARHLRKCLGDPLPGGGFLDFHGDQASAHWKGFGLALEGLRAEGLVDAEQVIAGACTVFRRVYALLATMDQAGSDA
ncbi:biliverdin-producing heme oxygenase [uncultured Thiodictyon sp.]|uniref:biliverdin-producing heme oxygenase n=1 Tax=uncultured Thiodictyon sp. TaxID=1846217 RepID=UPI0025F6CE40|nr:biliverdin-producing heme oxygenase [uncultured Thiodictyon sp.]